MKSTNRIHFDHLGKRNLGILILIFSMEFFLIGIFKPFSLLDSRSYKLIFSLGVLLLILYLSKLFWYRNVVQWNKKGIVIRINSLFEKSIRFNSIKDSVLIKKIMTITKNNGNKITIDLSAITEYDIQKLNEIINKALKN